MRHLFFNSNDDIGSIAVSVFNLLGIRPEIGESKNVLNGSYFEAAIFGIKLRIEENCYDYEDEFMFMLSLKHDVLQNVTVRDDDLHGVARVVQHLIADNLGLVASMEIGTELEG